jgi:hypothetical protein
MHRKCLFAALAAAWLFTQAHAQPIANAFTYQGELRDAEALAEGVFDVRFRLHESAVGASQVGPTVCVDNVLVSGGRFSVELDFGDVFNGDSRFLEIEVRPNTGLGCEVGTGFTRLTPRQKVTSTPYASFALTAETALVATTAATALSASNATNLNNQPPSFYTNAGNLTGTVADARLSTNVTTLSGPQTFLGAKTFAAAPTFSSAGSPFTVSSTSRVNNLNADLLDGLDSGAFAPFNHTHPASAITSGTLADDRIPSTIPRIGFTNVFSDTQVINVSSQTPLTLIGSSTSGTWVNLQNTGGGRTWNVIATGSANGEGPGKLLVRDQSGLAVRLTIDSAGRVGIGTTAPTSLFEIAQADAAMRIRNTNDPGGGYIQNSFSTLQLGLYNPTAGAWGVIPANSSRALLGMQNTGRVGTMTNTSGAPIWRNTIDDGAGNASFQGNVSANNMPAIKFASTAASGNFINNSVTLIENITVNVPASGFLRITARANVFLQAYDFSLSNATLELKETTSTEVAIKTALVSIGDGQPSASGMSWQGGITLEHNIPTGPGTRSFKLRLLHNTLNGTNIMSYNGAEISVMYLPQGL